MSRRALALSAASLLLAGCTFTVDQRAVDGPEAVKIWKLRFARSYGRSPSLEETARFDD